MLYSERSRLELRINRTVARQVLQELPKAASSEFLVGCLYGRKGVFGCDTDHIIICCVFHQNNGAEPEDGNWCAS
jgi:hypothetical protein